MKVGDLITALQTTNPEAEVMIFIDGTRHIIDGLDPWSEDFVDINLKESSRVTFKQTKATITNILRIAYQVSLDATMGAPIDHTMAEELCGTTAELLAHLDGEQEADNEAIFQLANKIKGSL